MSKSVNLYVAKTHLSDLVERAAAGEEIVIAKGGKPKARLVGLVVEKKRRRPGVWGARSKLKSKLWIAPDFDGPLPADLLATFLGSGK
jgi:prevent-host-death family protein